MKREPDELMRGDVGQLCQNKSIKTEGERLINTKGAELEKA